VVSGQFLRRLRETKAEFQINYDMAYSHQQDEEIKSDFIKLIIIGKSD